MDPVSAVGLASNIVGLAKELWTLGVFIYKKIEAAKESAASKKRLSEDFYIELLKVESFKSWFVKSQGLITNDSDLDKSWLIALDVIFARIGECFGEYRIIGMHEDADYQKLLGIEQSSKDSWFSKSSSKIKMNTKTMAMATRWSLFGEERIQRLITSFKACTEQLQQMLPHAIYALLQQSRLNSLQRDDFLKNSLGSSNNVISKNARIRGLQAGSKVVAQPELELKNSRIAIDATSTGGALLLAALELTEEKGNLFRETVLVEYKEYPTTLKVNQSQTVSYNFHTNVQKLAHVLHASGSDQRGTLPLRGFLQQPDDMRYAFVFDFPSEVAYKPPQTLLDAMHEERDNPWHLGRRFKTAQILATTIGDLHLDQVKHKNISSSSVAFFNNFEPEELQYERPFLVDFGESSLLAQTTARHYDNDAAKNVYRHPEMQHEGRQSADRVHDIYSLGVVLLELALWKPAPMLIAESIEQPQDRSADNIRKLYVHVARSQIAHRMGKSYESAVLASLTSKYDKEFRRPEFAVVYRREVLEKLRPELICSS